MKLMMLSKLIECDYVVNNFTQAFDASTGIKHK